MMANPYDPSQFFANLMKSGHEQMQKAMGGAAWAAMAPGLPDPTAQMAAAAKQFAELSQQYMASLGAMGGAGANARDMSQQMGAVMKQVTDLQQQYIAGLAKLTAMPAGAPDMAAQVT